MYDKRETKPDVSAVNAMINRYRHAQSKADEIPQIAYILPVYEMILKPLPVFYNKASIEI